MNVCFANNRLESVSDLNFLSKLEKKIWTKISRSKRTAFQCTFGGDPARFTYLTKPKSFHNLRRWFCSHHTLLVQFLPPFVEYLPFDFPSRFVFLYFLYSFYSSAHPAIPFCSGFPDPPLHCSFNRAVLRAEFRNSCRRRALMHEFAVMLPVSMETLHPKLAVLSSLSMWTTLLALCNSKSTTKFSIRDQVWRQVYLHTCRHGRDEGPYVCLHLPHHW